MVITIGLLSLVVGGLARRWPVVGPVAIGVFGIVGGRGRRRSTRWGRFVGRRTARRCRRRCDADLVLHRARCAPATARRPCRGCRGSPTGGTAGGSWSRPAVPPASPSSLPRSRASARARPDRSASRQPHPIRCHPSPTTGRSAARSCQLRPRSPPRATLSPATPFITPNDQFYLIDTALSVPRIKLDKWTVRGRWTCRSADLVDVRRSAGSATGRARGDHRLRLERGRRQPDRHCRVAGRAAGRHACARRACEQMREQVFSTSMDGWTCGLPDRARARRTRCHDRHRHERRGTPRTTRIPGTSDRARRVRLRQRDEVAQQDRADHVGRGSRLLGAAGLVARGADQDAVAHRRAAPGRRPDGRTNTDRRHRLGAAPRRRPRSRCASTMASGTRRNWAPMSPTTRGASGCSSGTQRPESTPSRCERPTTTGQTQTDEVSRPDPDGATGWHTRTVKVD